MKHISLLSLFLLFVGTTSQAYSQQSIQPIIHAGDSLFEAKEYTLAIRQYKEALAIAPASPLINYKLAYTYYTLHDYTLSEHFADIGVRHNDPDLDPLFRDLKATLFLETDRLPQGIDYAKQSLKKYPNRIALQFSLGLSYYKLKAYKESKTYTLQVLQAQPTHKTAHLLLGYLSENEGNHVQAALSYYYFLLLEPDSDRSAPTFEKLLQNLGITPLPTQKGEGNAVVITPRDGLFDKTAKMLPVFYAQTQVNAQGKDDTFYQFQYVSENLFKYLYLDDNSKKESFWRTFYVPFFFEIQQNNLIKPFCHYIRYQAYIHSYKWVNEHPKEVNAMVDFLNKHLQTNQNTDDK